MLDQKPQVSDYFITLQPNENFQFPPQNDDFLKNKKSSEKKTHKKSKKLNKKPKKNSSISSQNSTISTNYESTSVISQQDFQKNLEKIEIEKNKKLLLENQKIQYISKTNKNKGKGQDFPNQDSYISIPELNKNEDFHFFAVLDGHGQDGHILSEYVKNNLKQVLQQQLTLNPDDISLALENSYDQINNMLLDQQNICDVKTSGLTQVSVFLKENTIYCSNIGDSRAILGILHNDKITHTPLSCDHKPTNFDEQERIEQYGGKIYSLNQDSIQRVWIQDTKQKNQSYGLGVTRSLGDTIAEEFGVIHEPEIEIFEIKNKKQEFIILGTDGLFEYTSNQKICEIVGKNLEDLENASNLLMKQVCSDWAQQSVQYQDDITFTIIKFI